MIQQFLAQRFEDGLLQLKNEINSYTHKENAWKVSGEIKNPGGTLCLHLLGNLNHFIGANLGNSGYIRKREEEFALRNIPSSRMMKEIDETAYRIKQIISHLSPDLLNSPFPAKTPVETPNTLGFLIHLLAHLNYHVGQVNYHRRMIDQPVSLPPGVDKQDGGKK